MSVARHVWWQVFKQLQAAHSDKPAWLVGKDAANPFAAEAGGASNPLEP